VNEGASERVLVVDGNAVNRLLTQSLLEASGYPADVAIDGPHAVELMIGRRYGLVIVGASEPGPAGFEAAWQIRALGGKAEKLPILALSPIEATKMPAGLLDGHVLLPFDAADLISRVADRLGRPTLDRPARPPADETPPLVDTAQIGRLAGKMPVDKLRALFASYRDGHDARLARIEALLVARDLAGLEREAHDIKSTAGTFGTPRLGLLARCLERSCKVGDLEAAKTSLGAIRAAAEETWPLFERAVEAALRRPAEPTHPSAPALR